MAEFLCTRATLAAKLIDAGETPTRSANPFNPALTAWRFPINDSVRDIATEYYESIGKPLPKCFAVGGKSDE